MKQIRNEDLPVVSGGNGGACTDEPTIPQVEDYPRAPTIPYPDEPICPEQTA